MVNVKDFDYLAFHGPYEAKWFKKVTLDWCASPILFEERSQN